MKYILATTSTFAEESPDLLETITKHGFNIVCNPHRRQLKDHELDQLLKEHKPVGILAGTESITRAHLEEAASYLRVISRVGVGWDNVNRQVAGELGILVFRTLGVLDQAVAELTICLILCGLRSVDAHNRSIRQGLWQKRMGSLLQGKTVGIIGFGAIGQRVGELVNAFGASVIYYDPIPKNISWAKSITLKELLEDADVITLHASSKKEILGIDELNLISKRGVLLVNTARGSLVDEEALYQCLTDGRVACACLDVFTDEPYQGPLCKLENVVLTPHIGSYARESRRLMESRAVDNLLAGLREAGVL